jgi:hypothetical protein
MHSPPFWVRETPYSSRITKDQPLQSDLARC